MFGALSVIIINIFIFGKNIQETRASYPIKCGAKYVEPSAPPTFQKLVFSVLPPHTHFAPRFFWGWSLSVAHSSKNIDHYLKPCLLLFMANWHRQGNRLGLVKGTARTSDTLEGVGYRFPVFEIEMTRGNPVCYQSSTQGYIVTETCKVSPVGFYQTKIVVKFGFSSSQTYFTARWSSHFCTQHGKTYSLKKHNQ